LRRSRGPYPDQKLATFVDRGGVLVGQ
jgi:hypothetical protein